jgi:head-tail adaptor
VRGNALVEAGRRDRWVEIVRPVTTTNAHNEEIEGEPTRSGVFASMKPGPGTERFQNAETAAQAPMRFVFAYRPDLIRVTDRIEADDGRTYQVLWWSEIGRREGIEALATARAETEEE